MNYQKCHSSFTCVSVLKSLIRFNFHIELQSILKLNQLEKNNRNKPVRLFFFFSFQE